MNSSLKSEGSESGRDSGAEPSGYDALLLDLDGTVLDPAGEVRESTRRAVRALDDSGVRVMITTGRSATATEGVIAELGLEGTAVVFNGAGIWCPRERRLLEEHILAERVVDPVMDYAERAGHLVCVMLGDSKFAPTPRDEVEEQTLSGLQGLEIVERSQLPREYLMRITVFSKEHASSLPLFEEISSVLRGPAYLTHFPLAMLHAYRESTMQVTDVHPPCRGKAEALRWLKDVEGIDPERVACVGDATNDLPMFAAAGLAVAMGDGMLEARQAADRVIGASDTDAIAELIEELFDVSR
jgi:Cof subfamily protein (haloacid dehalogenase superfamily)